MVEVWSATVFEDVAAVVGPKRPDASVCFERAGFEKAADTTSVVDGFPRILMRRPLSRAL